jgi:hypothetical protein
MSSSVADDDEVKCIAAIVFQKAGAEIRDDPVCFGEMFFDVRVLIAPCGVGIEIGDDVGARENIVLAA